MAFQLRRGTEAERTAAGFIPAEAELIYITDTGKLYIGDGSTSGGVEYKTVEGISEITGITLSTEISRSISQYSVTSNVVTVTLLTAHDYAVDQQVTISESTVTALNGTQTITAISDSFSFSFALTTADVSVTAISGTVARQVLDGEVLTYNASNSYWTNSLPVTALQFLEDVNIEGITLADGMFLRYDSTLNAWTAETVNLTYSLDSLSDVTISGVSNSQVLQYNSTSGQWQNVTLAAIPGSIKDLSDVSDTDPTDGQLLQYNTTNSAWQPVTYGLADLSDVSITVPVDGQLLAYDSVNSDWRLANPSTPLLLDERFYYNYRDETALTVNQDQLGIVYSEYLERPIQISLAPDYDPTVFIWDLFEGDIDATHEFGNFTSIAGTATRANGYCFATGGNSEWCGTWNKQSTSSPLDDINNQKIWFEFDIKYEDLSTRGSSPNQILALRGYYGTSTTEREILSFTDNLRFLSTTKGRFSLDSYEFIAEEHESGSTGRAGNIWYRICGTFDFATGEYAVWLGQRDVDSSMTRIMAGTVFNDFISFDFGWNPTKYSTRNLRKIRFLYQPSDDYYLDNAYVGIGENRYAWQASETTISMDRTFGDIPKRGAIEHVDFGKVKSVTIATASIADNATHNANTFMGNSGFLRRITVDRACRVRIYISSSARTNDSSRSFTTAPANYIGLVVDHEFTAAGSINLTPCPIYNTSEINTYDKLDLYFAITNQSGATAVANVATEYTALEYGLY